MRLIKIFQKEPKLLIPRGKHTYGPEPKLVGYPRIGVGSKIGNFCSIAKGLQFIFRGKHMTNWVTTYPFRDMWKMDVRLNDLPAQYPIMIGNDVWIAANARIIQGVSIGDGAVIATVSFVTSDVPPYAIVGGHPARIIRFRFSQSQIEDLLEIAWWYWDDDDIRKVVPILCSEDVERFIAIAKEMIQNKKAV
jgi:acetyltransferase-like isoleucine patch superfamily enzyme